MKAGDRVRLKQLFKPTLSCIRYYRYGIVVDVLSSFYNTEVLVYLYDSKTGEIYTDESGIQAIYSFRTDELESL